MHDSRSLRSGGGRYGGRRPGLTTSQEFPTSGARVLGCRLVGLLGGTGSTRIYEAVEESSDQRLAVRVLLQRRSDPLSRARYLAARVQHMTGFFNPAIAPVIHVQESGEDAYIVSELIGGTRLEAVLLERGHIEVKAAVDLGKTLAEALDYAHRVGLVHTALHPSKIRLERDGSAKLVDLGFARPIGRRLPYRLDGEAAHAVRERAKDDPYAAPELQDPELHMQASVDVYALGRVLWHAAGGVLPPPGGRMPPHPGPRDPLLAAPPQLRDLISRMSDTDPRTRLPSCADAARALGALARELEDPNARYTARTQHMRM